MDWCRKTGKYIKLTTRTKSKMNAPCRIGDSCECTTSVKSDLLNFATPQVGVYQSASTRWLFLATSLRLATTSTLSGWLYLCGWVLSLALCGSSSSSRDKSTLRSARVILTCVAEIRICSPFVIVIVIFLLFADALHCVMVPYI